MSGSRLYKMLSRSEMFSGLLRNARQVRCSHVEWMTRGIRTPNGSNSSVGKSNAPCITGADMGSNPVVALKSFLFFRGKHI